MNLETVNVIVYAVTSSILGFIPGWWIGRYLRGKRLAKLQTELESAIAHSQPSWADVVEIGRVDGFTRSNVYSCVRKINKKIMVGKAPELELHKGLIQTYIEEQKKADPFAGIPNEIRVYLERLHVAVGNQTHLIDPLTTQIRELVSVYESDKLLQKRLAVWGFVVGLVGLGFAAYTYFYPPHA